METRVLKSSGEFKEFNPGKRERVEGLFLVYRKGEDLALFIDESGKMFHLALRAAVKKMFELPDSDIVGAGRYRFRESRFMHSDKPWGVGVEKGLYKELTADLLGEVARKICDGEAWMKE